MALRPPSSAPDVTSLPTILGSSEGLKCFVVGDLDAEPVEKSVMAEVIDRRLVGGEIERRDLGGLHAIGTERCLGPFADEFTGLEIVGREGRVGRVDSDRAACRAR